jgi:hypothetical protein
MTFFSDYVSSGDLHFYKTSIIYSREQQILVVNVIL